MSGNEAWQCACGYEFGQSVDTALELLRDQLRNQKIQLGLLLAVDIVAIPFMAFLKLIGVIGIVLLFGATARVARRLSITRASIRNLSQRALPKATLRKP
jgi:hypothetical protein